MSSAIPQQTTLRAPGVPRGSRSPQKSFPSQGIKYKPPKSRSKPTEGISEIHSEIQGDFEWFAFLKNQAMHLDFYIKPGFFSLSLEVFNREQSPMAISKVLRPLVVHIERKQHDRHSWVILRG